MTVFGARVRRKEDGRLITGRGRYVSDVELPRMLHVAFVRSVHAHARIVTVDARAAMAAPGMVAVATGADADIAPHRIRARSALPGYVETDQPVLAGPEARFAGEALAAVVAADRYAAEDAAALVAVRYEPLPAAVDVVAARGGAAVVHVGAPDNVLLSRRFESGEVEKALADSAVIIDRTFRTNRQTAAPLEGRGGIAHWNAGEGKLTLWSGTQVPHLARHGLSELLGLAENRIRVIAPDVGGGFGVKAILYPEDVVLCLLALRLGRAVKWVEERREGLQGSAHARDHHYAVRAGFDRAGRLLVMDVRSRAMPARIPSIRGRPGSRRSWRAGSWPGPTSWPTTVARSPPWPPTRRRPVPIAGSRGRRPRSSWSGCSISAPRPSASIPSRSGAST